MAISLFLAGKGGGVGCIALHTWAPLEQLNKPGRLGYMIGGCEQPIQLWGDFSAMT